jgi:hypothetical protein
MSNPFYSKDDIPISNLYKGGSFNEGRESVQMRDSSTWERASELGFSSWRKTVYGRVDLAIFEDAPMDLGGTAVGNDYLPNPAEHSVAKLSLTNLRKGNKRASMYLVCAALAASIMNLTMKVEHVFADELVNS